MCGLQTKMIADWVECLVGQEQLRIRGGSMECRPILLTIISGWRRTVVPCGST
jgi:hypothetical protein